MSAVTLCECFARDGLQHEPAFVPTATKRALVERFALSDRQAEDILEIRLRQLARLEAIRIEQELKELRGEREKLEEILGSPAGGGCVMCHSSSDSSSPNYSTRSVGFFDKRVSLFDQPTDGGQGIVQTEVDDAGGIPAKRVDARFVAQKPDGSPLILDLSTTNGDTVGNSVRQGDVLGFDPAYLANLVNSQIAGIAKANATFGWTSDACRSRYRSSKQRRCTCDGNPASVTADHRGNAGDAIAATYHVA